MDRGVCKTMIKSISREPMLNKITLGISICFLISGIILNLFHIAQLNNLYKEERALTQRIVGGILNNYPEAELSVMQAIKNADEVSLSKGSEVLSKFGYKESSIFQDESFSKYAYDSFKLFAIITAIVITLNFLVLNKSFKWILSLLFKISNYLDNFMNNNYKICDPIENEGLFSYVLCKLSNLGKKWDIESHKLTLEKENLKSLVTDISHQLKTPLASLNLYNSILLQNGISEGERADFLIKNEASITKLHNLIDALVNISRLESNLININPEYSSIKNTIIKAINSAYVKAMDKNINISLEEFEDIKIYHDIKWTEESIFNVLDNAIKYTPMDGNIVVAVSFTINYLRIDIKDNGIGINKEEINHIFKRFYRGENKTIKDIEGSGVGLYLTRKILEEQGGNIIATANTDVGSTFSLLLQKCETGCN